MPLQAARRSGPDWCAGRKDAGAAIALELWSMPLEAFGGFMRTIPSPLGIGTITLADGATVQGFLCERQAVEAAKDITAIGDWRKFLSEGAHPVSDGPAVSLS